MGGWKIEYWKTKADGTETGELSDIDLEHIAQSVKEGYVSGEVSDDEESDGVAETDAHEMHVQQKRR